MKKIKLLFVLIFIFTKATAQTDGMSYQAVIIKHNTVQLPGQDQIVERYYANTPLNIKFTIINAIDNVIEYQESQFTTTNTYGMVNLIIGKGLAIRGEYEKIYWGGNKKILKVETDLEGYFSELSTQELLYTPFALHRELIATSYFKVYGPVTFYNSLSVHGITNLFNNFNVQNQSPTNLTGTLNVEKATTLQNKLDVLNQSPTNLTGTLNVQKATTLQNKLDVLNQSPTNLTGTLNVEKATTLQNKLDVLNQSPTNLTGTLNVEKATTLQNKLDVLNQSPTNLTGTLNVQKATTLQNKLDVLNQSPTNLTGTLNVEKATTLQNKLDVLNQSPTNLTGTLNVEKATTLQNKLDVLNQFPTNLTGTLNVEKATTLQNKLDVLNQFLTNLTGTLNVEKATTLQNKLDVLNQSPTNLTGTLNVEKATTLQNKLDVLNQSPTNLTGTLNVEKATTLQNKLDVLNQFPTNLTGTLNVEKATTLQSTLLVNGKTLINVPLTGLDSDLDAYPLKISGSNQGIIVQLDAITPDSSNNFMTFLNRDGNPIGSIEGQTADDVNTDPQYVYDNVFYVALIALDAVKVGLAAIPIVSAGLGAVVGVDFGGVAAESASLVFDSAQYIVYQSFSFNNLGVTYSSGSADYAEWLKRINKNEIIESGDIVGVIGGEISKNTKNVKQYMVISSKPALLGNVQSKENEPLFEKVAFMGQIPVKVFGLTTIGDYILPSGLNDGIGKAVSPSDIKPEQYHEIVGVAWSSSIAVDSFSYINMAIGLNNNDLANIATLQEKKITDFEERLNALERLICGKDISKQTTNSKPIVAEKVFSRKELIIKYLPNEVSNQTLNSILETAINGQEVKSKYLKTIFHSEKFKSKFVEDVKVKYKELYNKIIFSLN
jgi:hypothetical protein